MRTPRCHRLTRVYWLYRGIRSPPGGTRGKRGQRGERERGKKGRTVGKNGQWTNERTPSIVYSHATNWGANRFVRVRILLFVRPWKMSCPDARDGRGKIFHKHEYFATIASRYTPVYTGSSVKGRILRRKPPRLHRVSAPDKSNSFLETILESSRNVARNRDAAFLSPLPDNKSRVVSRESPRFIDFQ